MPASSALDLVVESTESSVEFARHRSLWSQSSGVTGFPLIEVRATPGLLIFRTGGIYNTSSKTLTVDKEYSIIDFTSRQLRAFLLVAQHRSFSRAAGALFITPSGLSLLIRELETRLGVRLFERTTRNVALTAFGTELLTVAQRNLQELDGVMSRIGQSASETGVSLSVGTPPLLMASVLAPAIQEFRSHRPELRFQLFDIDTTSAEYACFASR